MNNELFNLPGEIRNRIYELALTEGHGEQEHIELEQASPNMPFQRMKTYNPEVICPGSLATTGLPLTCKVIRCETLRLYYSLNKFYFQTEYLKSNERSRIIERVQEWVNQVGLEQAKEIRDITISLTSLKGREANSAIDWDHMMTFRKLFHPQCRLRIKFCLEGNGTATFTLGRRDEVERELDRMEARWCCAWERARKLDAHSAFLLGRAYRSEVDRVLQGMPEEV